VTGVQTFALPFCFFPECLQPLPLALPFASIVQTPADVFVGRLQGVELAAALSRQALWAVALLASAQALCWLATRRVVIQGG